MSRKLSKRDDKNYWLNWIAICKTELNESTGLPRRMKVGIESGLISSTSPVSGPDDLRDALIRNPEQFVQTFTERFLIYALGRTVDYRDMPAVRKIVREAGKKDYRFSELVWQVVGSEPFRMRTAPAAEAPVVAQAAAE